MFEGVVSWFNNNKGYGFIKYKNNDIFVHYSVIIENGFKTLISGEKVSFNIRETENGLRAINVRSISKIESM